MRSRVMVRCDRRFSGTGAFAGFRMTGRIDGQIVESHDIPPDSDLVRSMRKQMKERLATKVAVLTDRRG